jgi:serine/threonine protein kinase
LNLACFEQLGLSDLVELKSTGQKTVYTGISSEYDKVVLKIVKPGQNIERIKREIEIVKECRGFNTSIIHDNNVISQDGQEYFYIIESFIDGVTLKEHMTQHGKLDYDEVCKFLNAMLNILQILEQRRLVHRDIKPDNIIRTTNGEYFLIDFGIARDLTKESLTDTNNRFGPHTVGYAPIEQINNEKKHIDSRVDIYSVGLIAYEMLMGFNPFLEGCEHIAQVFRKVEKGSYPLLENNKNYEEVNTFIYACMNKFRSRRPATAQEAYKWFEEIYKQLI